MRLDASRRSVLLATMSGFLAGCAATPEHVLRPSTQPTRTQSAPRTASATTAPQVLYTPLAGEVEPAAKEAAARLLQTLASWGPNDGGADAARERIVALGENPALVDQAPQLLDQGDAAALQIVYPQYGGLSSDRASASLLTICEQTRYLAGEPTPRVLSTVVDVRLERDSDRWSVRALLPASPADPVLPMSDGIEAALDNDRLRLPAPARDDLLSGKIVPEVVAMLQGLSTRWVLDVCVLSSGHPENVFGSERPSNHTLGRAVDIWAIDEIPVIDQGRSQWQAVMTAAHQDFGADEVGGPEDVDKVRGRPYFTDLVHQDHVHLGFEDQSGATEAPVQ